MNSNLDQELERDLTALTTWDGPTPELWRAAERSASRANSPRRKLLPLWTLPIGGVAAAALIVALSSTFLQTARTAREISSGDLDGDRANLELRKSEQQKVSSSPRFGIDEEREAHTLNGKSSAGDGRNRTSGSTANSSAADQVWKFSGADSQASAPATNVDDAQRQVIRKATIELGAGDVRAAFARAALLVSEARGEYVQESALAGADQNLQANLTLRIAADRLSGILNDLRQLGVVRNESAGGEDVTGQVVDVEARLRNERRVEQELLDLLEKRKDAPLKEILELRTSIGSVRQSIEQLTGQRERLSRLVSLATVLVIIRPADAPPPERPDLGGYLWNAVTRAAEKGAKALVDTAAALVAILIGGAIWWALLIVATLIGRRYYLRAPRPA